jgi:hypothetical protein
LFALPFNGVRLVVCEGFEPEYPIQRQYNDGTGQIGSALTNCSHHQILSITDLTTVSKEVRPVAPVH